MASLQLQFSDALRRPLIDIFDLDVMEHQTNRTVVRKKEIKASSITVTGLRENTIYAVRVFPLRHRPVAQFVRTGGGDDPVTVTLYCPVHPDRAEATFPAFDDLPEELRVVLDRSTLAHDPDPDLRESAPVDPHPGQTLYDSLSRIRKAGLLNVFAKMRETSLGGRPAWDYVTDVYRVRGDRIFANVAVDLRDVVTSAASEGQFRQVDGGLHKAPDGFEPAGSFKTGQERYGNLQLTFFSTRDTPKRFTVDVDIDDAAGIGHVFQVLDHWITDSRTHPFDIHQILSYHQAIIVPYVLTA
jgi:hypothetical protein